VPDSTVRAVHLQRIAGGDRAQGRIPGDYMVYGVRGDNTRAWTHTYPDVTMAWTCARQFAEGNQAHLTVHRWAVGCLPA